MRSALFIVLAMWGTLLPAPASAGEATPDEPVKVLVVGGPAVISDGTLAHLQQCTGGNATRMAGSNRYVTARTIASLRTGTGGVVYVASGERFADALGAGAAANAQGSVLVLVRRNEIPAPSLSLLDRLQPSAIVIAGGESAVGPSVEAALRARYGVVTRVAGQDRYATSAAISRVAFPSANAVIISTGEGFVDALAAAPLAAHLSAPLMLTNRTTLPVSVSTELLRISPKQIFIVGGTAVVGVGVEESLQALLPAADVIRLAGSTRYETAHKIASILPPNPDRLIAVTARNFPDALAAGAVAGTSPLVLVDKYGLPPASAGTVGAATATECKPMVSLGRFTTYHPSGQARVTNIHLIADEVKNAVVGVGEIFSVNERTGKRTLERGYVRAGAIIGGKLVCCSSETNIGGGTSQFSTTLYNAVFYAALEDVFHRPHSVYFSRYPLGVEATLNWTSPDLKFRNDTLWPVTIAASYTSTSVSVEIWGWHGGRKVTKTVTGSATTSGGGEVDIVRVRTFPDGSTYTDRWHHGYNPLKSSSTVAPHPEPEPDPDPPVSGPF